VKLRTTIILVVVLAAVIAYVAFYEPKMPTTEEVAEKSKQVFDLRSEDVTSLSILTGSTEIAMRKTGDRQWILESPSNGRPMNQPSAAYSRIWNSSNPKVV